MLPASEHPFLCGICADHNKAAARVPAGKGLLTLMLSCDWSIDHYDDTDEQIINASLEGLEKVLPGISADIEFAEVMRWSQRYNPPGHYRDIGKFREICSSTDKRIQLAGDYFAYADVESAICSGERAANDLIKIL